MAVGDILKWKDKTMIAAGPGLVADPEKPGMTHALHEVLQQQPLGFQGIFRPA